VRDHGSVTTQPLPQTRRLYRSDQHRVVAGVAHGLAEHLGVAPWLIMLGFVLLSFSGGAGVVAYGAFWALVPLRPDDDGEHPGRAAAGAAAADAEQRTAPLLGLAALGIGLALLLQHFGVAPAGGFAVPIVVLGLGVAVLWRVADDAQRSRWRASATAGGGRAWLRVALGLVLVVAGAVAVVDTGGGYQVVVQAVAAALLVLAGVALVAGPWVAHIVTELRAERLERIRSQERAELAAHVHDSVLQTLTLIQRNAADPRTVVRLARTEERTLRRWLYAPTDQDPTTLRPALERAAAEVEELHGVPIEVVVVGDAPVDERLGACLLAAREAMVNAVKYAGEDGPVAVYAEVADGQVEIFVRDRGPGFDLAAVPADRLGVRRSVIGRTERAGGRAEVRSSAEAGTEVRLRVPVAAPDGSTG
jgi:signal transduction histidine kinase/phage shock protein PspC (stress-responsive transcriptional regulator)